ncbi:PIN domain nuclease [Actinoplanes sp. Pm04-4]|uniref:Ribonuclease VapC n=1 Tax=Paractinoplanes pyxinae TaxID=2997416 RepID=A0ABT4B5N1_9ACTN|nr:PIN domain nuclease [Actinoplanes pyxinae]MCY1141781.1 PIN domain nuclease [Actinoplanes pyxinae]
MNDVKYLADTSAVVRILRSQELLAHYVDSIGDGAVAVCAITELEHYFGVRSKADHKQQVARLRETFSWVVMPQHVFEQAAEVQVAMIERGTHRSAGPIDLLTAATAQRHGLGLLHYDADFEQVAAVTGQPTQWVAKPGSID